MSEEKFDAIIVGGGLAGLTAGYTLANAGLEVLLLERGSFCGSKNVTGGRLYGHSLEKIIPNFAQEAPVERKITKERISLMTEKGAVNIEYANEDLGDKECASYSVLRSKFDQWFAGKCEEAGVMMCPGIRVDKCLLDENGKVIGIDAAGEEMYADVVILADGVNSLLAQSLGMKQELDPMSVAVGVKEVIKFDEDVINQRFGVKSDEGVAWLTAGDATMGNIGGGFLYTNKDSLCVGIVTTAGDIGRADISTPDMLERFKNHPSIAPYLEGGVPLEYSAHLVPEGGYKMIPELYRDGVLVTGDAAALVINLGYCVRGMDFAIESGRLAAEAVIKAKEAGDFSAKTLSAYKTMLESSFVIADMKQYQNFPQLLEEHAIFNEVPEIADTIMDKLFRVDGGPPESLPMFAVNEIAKKASARQMVDFIMLALNSL